MLSTCNRTEIYVVAEKFHGAYRRPAQLPVRDGVPAARGLRRPPLRPARRRAAVAHLFAVTAGLESAVVGEAEILGQVRQAWERAQEEGTAGSVAQPAVPPRPRGRQAGPHRDRHRPPHRLGVLRRGGDGRRAARLARRRPRPRARRRRDGRGHGRRRWPRAGRRRHPASPTAPERGSGRRRWPTGVGGRAVRLLRPGRRPRRGRPAAHLHRFAIVDHARARRPGRSHGPAPAGRCSSSTWPCPATSTPPSPTLDGVTLLDMDDLRASPTPAWPSAPPRWPRSAHHRAEEVERFAEESAAREVAPLVASCTSGPRRSARPSSSASPAAGRARRAPAGHRRGAHQGHRRQAAARADGRAEGRGGHAARRAAGRGPPRPVRP